MTCVVKKLRIGGLFKERWWKKWEPSLSSRLPVLLAAFSRIKIRLESEWHVWKLKLIYGLLGGLFGDVFRDHQTLAVLCNEWACNCVDWVGFSCQAMGLPCISYHTTMAKSEKTWRCIENFQKSFTFVVGMVFAALVCTNMSFLSGSSPRKSSSSITTVHTKTTERELSFCMEMTQCPVFIQLLHVMMRFMANHICMFPVSMNFTVWVTAKIAVNNRQCCIVCQSSFLK